MAVKTDKLLRSGDDEMVGDAGGEQAIELASSDLVDAAIDESETAAAAQRNADCKSAIRQIENLRYDADVEEASVA